MNDDGLDALYERYKSATRGEGTPFAMVDLDALDHNVRAIVGQLRGNKTLRIASKSVRSPALLRAVAARGGPSIAGVMAYCPAEAAFLAEQGFTDLLVAYPSASPPNVKLAAEAARAGVTLRLAADDPVHLDVASAAAKAAGVTLPIVIDVDVAYRPLRSNMHLGVRRSPLREPRAVADLAERAASTPGLSFGGILAYEAHIAGLPDRDPSSSAAEALRRGLKRVARGPLLAQRAAIVAELNKRGLAPPLVNGGGTGSVAFSSDDPSLTEVAAGSGFLDSHLFDRFDALTLTPAAFFACEVTRRPGPGFVTCQGGGLVASGAMGPDRLPIPYLPPGLSLTTMEGAGEVQTPLNIPSNTSLSIGEPVFFRHAKAGELAEHIPRYLLVRGDRVEGYAETYRGLGRCFG